MTTDTARKLNGVALNGQGNAEKIAEAAGVAAATAALEAGVDEAEAFEIGELVESATFDALTAALSK